MAGTFTKIPTNTFNNLQTDAGVLLKSFEPENPTLVDEDILCATTGGIGASCVPTYFDMGEDVDNCPNGMLELMEVSGWDCKLSFTSISVNPSVTKLSLGASDIDTESGSTVKITPRKTLTEEDFVDVWWVGDTKAGGMVAVHLMRALSTGGFSLQTTKNGKGQLAIELSGHVSIQEQDVVPMEFYFAGPDAITTQGVEAGENIPAEPETEPTEE